MKCNLKLIIIFLMILTLPGCSICKANTYKEDITIKYKQELNAYFGDYKIKDRASAEENLCNTKTNTHDKYTTWTLTYINNNVKKEVILNNRDELKNQIDSIINDNLIKEILPLVDEYLSEKHTDKEKILIGNIPEQITLTNLDKNILTSNSKIYIYLKTKNSTNNSDIHKILTEKIGQNINYIIMDKGTIASTYCIDGVEYKDKYITLEDYLNYLEEN